MENNQFYEALGFVKVSPVRKKTLKALGDGLKMPSEIGREIDIRTNQVSSALLKLRDKNVVVCVNEEATKGRLYKCTPLGLEVLKYID
jgi:predicted transcriptional regulator